MTQPPTTERELPMLAGIGAFVTWCEDLLAILSGPILTAGLGIALVALLTDGQLLVSVPALLWVWAISQAIGLDAQFIGAAAKLARAVRTRRIWPIIGYALLCAALGYVGYLASNVFATQEANGITTAEALARLGMDSTSWIVQRSLLAVALVFLSGFLRYVAPAANVALSADEERAQLEADLMLEPLRAQKRAMQARGWRDVGAAALGKEPGRETRMNGTDLTPQTARFGSGERTEASNAPSAPETPSDDPPPGPTGPGSPVRRRRQAERGLNPGDSDGGKVVTMPRSRRRTRTASKRVARGSVELLARRHFASGMSAGELMRVAGISKGAASKWRGILQAEVDAAQQSQQPDQGQQAAQ